MIIKIKDLKCLIVDAVNTSFWGLKDLHVWTNFANFSKRLPVKAESPGLFYSKERNVVIFCRDQLKGKVITVRPIDASKECENPTAYMLAIIDRLLSAHLSIHMMHSYKEIPIIIKYPSLFKKGEQAYSFTCALSRYPRLGMETPRHMRFEPVDPKPLGRYKLKHGEIVRK